MLSCETQIVAAYEQGATPNEIAEELGFDVIAVKAKLHQLSKKYRSDVGLVSATIYTSILDYTEEETKQVSKVILELALGSEDENIRLKAAMYVRDDKLGRKNIPKQVIAGASNNFMQFNQFIQESREQAKRLKDSLTTNSTTTTVEV